MSCVLSAAELEVRSGTPFALITDMHANPSHSLPPPAGGGYQAISNFFCWLRQKLQAGISAVRNLFKPSAAETEQLPKSERKRQRKEMVRQIQEKDREARR